jgi:excisionase family DNA binding protein
MSDLTLTIPDALLDRLAELLKARLADEQSEHGSSSPYLSVAEAAERLRSKPQRVYDLLSARRLTRYKDGSRTLLSREEIDAYLAGEGRSRVAPGWPPHPQSGLSKGLAK